MEWSLIPRLLVLAVTTSVVASAAAAQQAEREGLQLRTSSFVYARYASASASVLYAARGLGPIGGFVAMIQNPKTQYRELIAGTFTQLNWNRQSVLVAIAYADASESQYLQMYLIPSITTGRIALSGTLEWYEPLGRAGTRQFDVNPISPRVRVSDHLWAGAAYTAALADHETARHRIGPVLEWATQRDKLRVELLDRTFDHTVEVRVAILAGF
ncbi:MAG TPA: hypothetical protein VGQ29_13435 [Gemmatimonadales bacterium]|nr:hypothetical protein [Gemmatimonadales bacterium]